MFFCIFLHLLPACIQDSSEAHIFKCEDTFFKLGVKENLEYIAVEESTLQSH